MSGAVRSVLPGLGMQPGSQLGGARGWRGYACQLSACTAFRGLGSEDCGLRTAFRGLRSGDYLFSTAFRGQQAAQQVSVSAVERPRNHCAR